MIILFAAVGAFTVGRWLGELIVGVIKIRAAARSLAQDALR